MAHEADALTHSLLFDLVGGGFKGPVDEHGTAYDVFAGNKAPVTTVERFGAVIAHGEDLAGRDDEVAVLDVVGEIVGPACGDLALFGETGGDGGKVVAVGLVGVLGIVVYGGHAGVGLVLSDAVEVDDTVAEVEVVTGDGDGALDEVEVGRLGVGLEEDDDVAAMDWAVEDEGSPFGGRGQGDAVYEDVVADEEGLLHGGGGDLEVLEDEGHDEEADREDGADGGERFECGLFFLVLVRGDGLLFGEGGGGIGQRGLRALGVQRIVYR